MVHFVALLLYSEKVLAQIRAFRVFLHVSRTSEGSSYVLVICQVRLIGVSKVPLGGGCPLGHLLRVYPAFSSWL